MTAEQEHLELQMCDFIGALAGLVFATGYAANLAAVAALADADTLVISDARNHASIIDACRLPQAGVAIIGHNDVVAVQHLLTNRTQAEALVITESGFRADGD